MGTPLYDWQVEIATNMTNAAGAEFDPNYIFENARMNHADNIMQITVNVLGSGLLVGGQDRVVKGFWLFEPEFRETVVNVNQEVQKQINRNPPRGNKP